MAHDLSTIIQGQRQQFIAVLADSTIEFEREAAFALQLVAANSYLAGIAGNNQDSLRNAITNVAAIGISLNPASKLAYLVPRDGKVCLDISYMGLMHIAQQSGAIVWGQSAIVRDNDEFALDGIDKPPLHKFNPFATDRGEIIGAYVVVKTDTGDYLTHAMPISKIHDIRDRSEAWKRGQKGPWKTDAEEMIKKTVIKQAAKMWPRRDRLDSAIHNLNTDGEGITFDHHDGLDDETVQDLIKSIEATNTKPEAKDKYIAAVEVCRQAQDTAARDKIKAALIAHGEKIDQTINGEYDPQQAAA